MKVQSMEVIDFENIYKILTSNKISEIQKTRFIASNKTVIRKVMEANISSVEFKSLMENRVLQKFRPLKNSFTKRGDKLLLAKALELPPAQVPQYIKNVIALMDKTDSLKFLTAEKMEIIKTYIYRHGSKDELVTFLDYELTKTKDLEKILFTTLKYYSGGVADYFIRPIHRMDNKTFVKIFQVLNKHIKKAKNEGHLSEAKSEKIAKRALIQLYRIQNNSKLINAIKTYKELS